MHCYATTILYVVLCLYLSQAGIVLQWLGGSGWFLARTGGFLRPEIWISPKIWVFLFGALYQPRDLDKLILKFDHHNMLSP